MTAPSASSRVRRNSGRSLATPTAHRFRSPVGEGDLEVGVLAQGDEDDVVVDDGVHLAGAQGGEHVAEHVVATAVERHHHGAVEGLGQCHVGTAGDGRTRRPTRSAGPRTPLPRRTSTDSSKIA